MLTAKVFGWKTGKRDILTNPVEVILHCSSSDLPIIDRLFNKDVYVIPKAGDTDDCDHVITDITNKAIKSGYMCIKCGKLFAAAKQKGETPEPCCHEWVKTGAILASMPPQDEYKCTKCGAIKGMLE